MATFISNSMSSMADPFGETAETVRRLESSGTNVIKLIIGDPSRYFKIQENIAEAYTRAVTSGKTFYTEGQGLLLLREAVANRYAGMYAADFSADDVIITQGVVEALDFLNRSLVSKNDRALLMAPFFTQYAPSITINGGMPLIAHYSETKNWGITYEDLEKTLRGRSRKPKYMLITNPNNPTGSILSEKNLREVIEFAKDNEIFLVSDEIYDEIVYNGVKLASVSKLGEGVPRMILNGASKNYAATGFRLGFSIIPGEDKKSKQLREAFVKLSYSRLSANTPSQYAMVEGLENKQAHKKFIRDMVSKIATRTNLASKIINQTAYLSSIKPSGAFYVLAKINLGLLDIKTDAEFVQKLITEEHVQLTRGSSFGTPGYVRLVSLPPEDVLVEAVRRVERFCKRHRK